MASPFDVIKSISSSAGNEVLEGKIEKKDVNSYMVLRGLSYYEDTVLFADEINAHAGMPQAYVYHSMHALVQPKRNRFSKWIKPIEEFPKDVIAYIINLHSCSRADAIETIRLMQEAGELEAFVEKYVKEKK